MPDGTTTKEIDISIQSKDDSHQASQNLCTKRAITYTVGLLSRPPSGKRFNAVVGQCCSACSPFPMTDRLPAFHRPRR